MEYTPTLNLSELAQTGLTLEESLGLMSSLLDTGATSKDSMYQTPSSEHKSDSLSLSKSSDKDSETAGRPTYMLPYTKTWLRTQEGVKLLKSELSDVLLAHFVEKGVFTRETMSEIFAESEALAAKVLNSIQMSTGNKKIYRRMDLIVKYIKNNVPVCSNIKWEGRKDDSGYCRGTVSGISQAEWLNAKDDFIYKWIKEISPSRQEAEEVWKAVEMTIQHSIHLNPDLGNELLRPYYQKGGTLILKSRS